MDTDINWEQWRRDRNKMVDKEEKKMDVAKGTYPFEEQLKLLLKKHLRFNCHNNETIEICYDNEIITSINIGIERY